MPRFVFLKASIFSSKNQGNNRSISRSKRSQGKCIRSRSRIFCIAAILILNNTLLIAHFSFESLGPIDCVLELGQIQSTR